MPILPVLAASLLALAGGAGPSTQVVTSPGPVTALAADGARVAFAAGPSRGDCDRVRIWQLSTGRVTALGRSTACVRTSTGTGIAAVSLAGTRALWLHYTGGNTREWSLFTATPSAPRPRKLRFAARDVDAVPPIVLGEGGSSPRGGLLPYAVDRDVVVLRASGARAFSWLAPARVTALGARGLTVAVALADGRIVVHELGGEARELAGAVPASRVFVTGNHVAAQRGRTVELHAERTYRATLPAGAALRDAEGFTALYTSAGRVLLLDLRTGAVRDAGSGAHARLEAGTIFASSGRVVRVLRP